MEDQVQIRTMRPEDMETVVRIQEAIIQRKISSDFSRLAKLQLAKPDGLALVAELKDEVIGFFFGGVKHGDFGLEHSGWVEMFGVSPKVMGEGVGRALAREAFDRFREMGVKEVYTAVSWDAGDLLAFFKKIGFGLSNFINLKMKLD